MKLFDDLIENFEKLPGIGHRTAERLAYAILDKDQEYVTNFSNTLLKSKEKIHPCPKCGLYTDEDLCEVCKDNNRVQNSIIVVSSTRDALAIENVIHDYKYFVLNGNISLLKNITPDKLNIDILLNRIDQENIQEVILATDSTLDGETTAQYLSNLLSSKNLNVYRIGYGLPYGSEIDYLDKFTIERAIKNKNKLN